MAQDRVDIRRALISVWDKSGLEEFLKRLDPQRRHIQIISSGGTAGAINKLGYHAIEISEYTGYPESPGGYVKTLHPKVHGGLLLDHDNERHLGYMQQQGIKPIDLVVVNLYPFSAAVTRKDSTLTDARENIDIGGPTMVRSGAKNFQRVAVLTNWKDANRIQTEPDHAYTTLVDRVSLMKKAFAHTGEYDGAIDAYFHKQPDEAIAQHFLEEQK